MKDVAASYDVVIIGAGHNGLVAASYLGRAGLSVLVLERNESIGGATCSKRVFPGVDARLSVYSYLVSLFPRKIVEDLRLDLQLLPRETASYTPSWEGGTLRELLVSNKSASQTKASFHDLPGGADDYRGYVKFQEMQAALARIIWPTLLEPLKSRQGLVAKLDHEQRQAWEALVERPLGEAIESHFSNDLVRGMIFTDAKIGVCTHPHDSSLLQNRTFLYHVIGQGTGEWSVPRGGMGSLVHSLEQSALRHGVTIRTSSRVMGIESSGTEASVAFEMDESIHKVDTKFVLCNAAPTVLGRLMGSGAVPVRPADEGSVIKINLLLKRLPRLKSLRFGPDEAFCGTFHIDEGYGKMTENHYNAMAGQLAEHPAGEMYCHTLTDNSILSEELRQAGWHTLTLFGLDMPYSAFLMDNDRLREEVLQHYLDGINRYIDEPVESCLALDENGNHCVEIKTPVDLEREIHLPRGNIFHNALSWPFVENREEAGSWGVETELPNVLLCGSGAKRGGAVSGVPGHNAAMAVLDRIEAAT
ncbi:MAG: phytoene desaturase family protein [Puniceicoccaceae bacterium]